MDAEAHRNPPFEYEQSITNPRRAIDKIWIRRMRRTTSVGRLCSRRFLGPDCAQQDRFSGVAQQRQSLSDLNWEILPARQFDESDDILQLLYFRTEYQKHNDPFF